VFNSPTDIKNETATSEDIQLYPNPANDETTLYWGSANGKRATVECVNGIGQKIFTHSFIWKDPKHSISLSGLEPGFYSIVIRNCDGVVVSSHKVLKLL
jgi:hypothetical protein